MAENPKIDPEFPDPDLIGELTAEEPATADGFMPMEPEPVEKIAVYKVISGEEFKMDEEEVTELGADGVADAVYRAAQGLMTKDGLAKHLLNRRDVEGRERAGLQERLKEGKCQKCLETRRQMLEARRRGRVFRRRTILRPVRSLHQADLDRGL